MRGVETMDKKEEVKYIVAFTYGDGYIGYHGTECRFEANNIIDNLDYINWRKSILENFTKVTTYEINDKRQNRKTIVKTVTRTNPIYTKVHSRMYLLGKKVIDPHYLTLLDWETLAIWYMDDGNLRLVKQDYKDSHYEYAVPNIATNCFSYGDNLLIKEAIKEKLGIEFNINKHSINSNGEQTYILSLQRKSFPKFLDGIYNYIFPSFQYKINPYVELVTGNADDDEIVRTSAKSEEATQK
jgi:hypothetical protein